MSKRIVAIDVFRGLLLISMTLNHLILFPFIGTPHLHSWLQAYVYNAFGFLSNSEGFFFVAGLTAGIVYGKKLLRGEGIWPRIKLRLKQMYLLHLTLLLSFTLLVAVSAHYHANWKTLHNLIGVWKDAPGIHYFLDNPFKGFSMGAFFLYLPPFFGILPLYILFLTTTPLLLKQLARGRWIAVIGVSVLCWVLVQYSGSGLLEGQLQQLLPVKLGWFHPFALQLLFVSGLTLGFAYANGKEIDVKKIVLVTAPLLVGLYFLFQATGVDVTNIHHLGLYRAGFFTLKLVAAYALRDYFTWSPIALIGRHPLAVFGFHFVLVYGLVLFLDQLLLLPAQVQVPLLITAFLSIWIPALILEKKTATTLAVTPVLQG